MAATTEQLVNWLERNKDPENLVRWLCKRNVDYKTLCHELEQITNLWCEVYGDAIVQKREAYRSGVQRIENYLQRRDNGINNKLVTKFLQLPFCQQRHLQAQGMLHDYTDCAAIDAMLNELVVLPPYIQGLRVTCRASKSTTKVYNATQQAVSAQAASAGSPFDASAAARKQAAPAPSTGAKRKRLPSPDREPAKKDGAVTKGKLSKVQQAGVMQTQLAKMLEVLQYSRAKPFELACALAFVSGRSLAELMAVGHFSIGDNSIDPASLCPGVLFRSHKANSSSCCAIPLLCDSSTFLAGIDRLRRMKVVQGKECKDINKSHCKTANTAAKTLLGCNTGVFTDLRVAYAALTYKLHGHESGSSNGALERQMQAWLAKCLPLTKLSTSPAFLTQCCAAHLATMQVPDSCRGEASVDVNNHDHHIAPAPIERAQVQSTANRDYVSDTRSIVLRVLPLLVRMYCKPEAHTPM
jgi:hypothetical protein